MCGVNGVPKAGIDIGWRATIAQSCGQLSRRGLVKTEVNVNDLRECGRWNGKRISVIDSRDVDSIRVA